MASENTTESWVLEGSSKANPITLPRDTSVLLRAGPFPRSSSHLSLATHDDYNRFWCSQLSQTVCNSVVGSRKICGAGQRLRFWFYKTHGSEFESWSITGSYHSYNYHGYNFPHGWKDLRTETIIEVVLVVRSDSKN